METVHPMQARREAKGLTQAELAELVCDYVENQTGVRPKITWQGISRLENRAITWPRASTREALRHILGAATNADLEFSPTRHRRLSRLTGPAIRSQKAAPSRQPGRGSPPGQQAGIAEQEIPPVRRRNFLVSAASLGVEGAMFRPTGSSAPAPRLRAQLAQAQALYRNADYAQLNRCLPDLIDRALGLGDPTLLAQVHILATELMLKQGKDPTACFTAAEARRWADQSDDPVCRAEAAWMMCVMLRHAGHPNVGFQVIQSAASDLEATGLRSETAMATFGHMMLTTAYTAAAAGYAPEARSFYAEGLAVAGKFDEDVTHNLWFFGPAQAAGYGISVANNLGDPGAALRAASSLHPDSLPSTERVERYWYDTTRAWLAAADAEKATEALRHLCYVAPEAARRTRVQNLANEAGMGQNGLNQAAAAGRRALRRTT